MKRFYSLFVAVLVAAVAFAGAEKGQKAAPRIIKGLTTHTARAHKNPVKRVQAIRPLEAKSLRQAPRRADEAATENYVRISSKPESWEGQYLIVYENGSVAMNGALTEKLDATENNIAVNIVDQEIAATAATDAASFTIAATDGGYTIRSASGLYMGQTSDANGLESSAETAFVNVLSIDGDGNTGIHASGGAYLRFNKASGQARFRYYKSATYTMQQPVVLYKKGGKKTEVVPTPEPGMELVVLPEGLETEPYALVAAGYVVGEYGWEKESVNTTVEVAFDGADVYISGLSYWVPDAFVKGTVQDGQIRIPNTYMGTDEYGYENFLLTYKWAESDDDAPIATEYMVFNFDAETGVMSLDEYYFYAETDDPNADGWYDYWLSATLTPGEAVQPEVVVLPEGLTPVSYILNAQSLSDDNDGEEAEDGAEEVEPAVELSPVLGVAYVAIDGTDAYISGLSSSMPEAWVKGTVKDGKIVVPSGQYLGAYEGWFENYDLYFVGYGPEGIADVTFTIDADDNTLTADNWVLTNASAGAVEPYEVLTDVVLIHVEAKAAMPADPEVFAFVDYDEKYEYGVVVVNVPIWDADDNYLSIDNLFYKIYVDEGGEVREYVFAADLYENLDEDITEVPFTLNDGYDFMAEGTDIYISLNAPTLSYDRVGVQSIYRVGDVENKTDIVWWTIKRGDDDAVAQLPSSAKDATLYDLSGRRVAAAKAGALGKGIYVVGGRKIVVK